MTKSVQRQAILLVSFAVAILISAVAFKNGAGKEETKTALIWTGRVAFFVFLIPFFASPSRALFKNKFTARLMRWRRNSGIAYGGLQVIHLLIIVWFFMISSSQPVDNDMLYIGGLGLVLVMGMLVTSFDGPTKAIGRKGWKVLHKSGFYICSFIYFYDFVIEPIELGKAMEYFPFAIITLAAMAMTYFIVVKALTLLTAVLAMMRWRCMRPRAGRPTGRGPIWGQA